jgi:capsular polysaccharide transport system permease protein
MAMGSFRWREAGLPPIGGSFTPPPDERKPGAARRAEGPMDATPRPPAAWPRPSRTRVIAALAIREMNAKFGRSAGGYVWAIAEPLGGILLLAIAFSLALRTPPLGTSFMLFYATGIIPFSMFSTMSKGVAGAVSTNRGLLNYPVVTALDAVLAKVVLNFLTVFLVGALLAAGVVIGFDLHVNLDLAAVLAAFALAALLGLGVGTLNCVLFGFFPTWKNVWGVLTRPLFILSSIFYTYESVPRAFQELLWWNPLVHVVALMRRGFYGAYDPAFVSYPYVVGLGLGLFVLGGWLLRRHAAFLIEQ